MKVQRIGSVYGGTRWKVTDLPQNPNPDEVADLCDMNNFGYRVEFQNDKEMEIVTYND